MPESRLPRLMTDFVEGSDWRRPPCGVRTTWKKVIADDLQLVLKPYNVNSKKWGEKVFTYIKDAAQDRKQWRGIIRDSIAAGDGQ